MNKDEEYYEQRASEINKRIEALSEEILANEEEIRFNENEIDELLEELQKVQVYL